MGNSRLQGFYPLSVIYKWFSTVFSQKCAVIICLFFFSCFTVLTGFHQGDMMSVGMIFFVSSVLCSLSFLNMWSFSICGKFSAISQILSLPLLSSLLKLQLYVFHTTVMDPPSPSLCLFSLCALFG